MVIQSTETRYVRTVALVRARENKLPPVPVVARKGLRRTNNYAAVRGSKMKFSGQTIAQNNKITMNKNDSIFSCSKYRVSMGHGARYCNPGKGGTAWSNRRHEIGGTQPQYQVGSIRAAPPARAGGCERLVGVHRQGQWCGMNVKMWRAYSSISPCPSGVGDSGVSELGDETNDQGVNGNINQCIETVVEQSCSVRALALGFKSFTIFVIRARLHHDVYACARNTLCVLT